MSLGTRIGLWAPVAAAMAAMWLASASALPQRSLGPSDKLLHAAAYLVFGVLCLRAFHGGFAPLRWVPSALALGLALGYGAVDELHQRHVPGRHASAADWVADAVGAAAALPCAHGLGRAARRVRREEGRCT